MNAVIFLVLSLLPLGSPLPDIIKIGSNIIHHNLTRYNSVYDSYKFFIWCISISNLKDL